MWKRIVWPTALVIVLWLGLAIGTTFYIRWLSASYTSDVDDNLTTIHAAAEMLYTVSRLGSAVIDLIEQDRRDQVGPISKELAHFEKWLAEADRTSYTPPEQVTSAKIRQRFAEYKRFVEGVIALGGPPPNKAHAIVELKSRANAIIILCHELREENEELIRQSTDLRARVHSRFLAAGLVYLVIGPVLGIACGLWVARGMQRSLARVSVTLQVAAGTMHHELGPIEVSSNGDLSALQEQVQGVAVRIERVMDELDIARREVVAAERLAMAGQLASGVAHEVRNPLTAIKLLVQMAHRPAGRPLGEEQLRVICEEIARIENTVQGLLNFARPPQPLRVRHDLRATLGRAANLVAGRAAQQSVKIEEHLPDAPLWVDADPELLHQVFVNLFLNGIESMAVGGVLRVALDGSCTTDSLCCVAVSDSGRGIAPELLERLFEPFVTDKQRGTGLGLAISRRIVEEHGGQLTAANAAEGGAVFRVALPCSRVAASADARPAGPLAPPSATTAATAAAPAGEKINA